MESMVQSRYLQYTILLPVILMFFRCPLPHKIFKTKDIALHALSLTIPHPVSKEMVSKLCSVELLSRLSIIVRSTYLLSLEGAICGPCTGVVGEKIWNNRTGSHPQVFDSTG